MTKIPPSKRTYAFKALQFLAFYGEDFCCLDELAEAVVVDVDQFRFNEDNRFLDRKHLLEICTCLITYDEGADIEVRLAHYSVKEYLTSARMRHGPAAAFSISKTAVDTLVAKTLITYLLDVNYEEPPHVANIIHSATTDESLSWTWDITCAFPLISLAIRR